ncbi:MAG TPA: hypothetical protein VF708_07460 [Pyrinomonadaceae bacterium]|jgi:hypothetical protein
MAQNFRIEPGRSAGKIKLGISRQEVHKTLGQPSATYSMEGKLTGDTWMANTGNDVRVIYRGGQVIQVKVTSASFKTPEGLTATSSLAEIQKHHTRLRKTRHFINDSGGVMIDYYDDVRRGIAFEFASVDSETGEFKPYAIVVHRPGQRVIPENGEEPVRYK